MTRFTVLDKRRVLTKEQSIRTKLPWKTSGMHMTMIVILKGSFDLQQLHYQLLQNLALISNGN
eukprot:m.337629 g.337629  ORF g.337629 m.337629 type:complete len:63 (+) comp16082_c0_seq18:238-426(+)